MIFFCRVRIFGGKVLKEALSYSGSMLNLPPFYRCLPWNTWGWINKKDRLFRCHFSIKKSPSFWQHFPPKNHQPKAMGTCNFGVQGEGTHHLYPTFFATGAVWPPVGWGQGRCIEGGCLCFAGFSGTDCSVQSCCNGHGSCEAVWRLMCWCDERWFKTRWFCWWKKSG